MIGFAKCAVRLSSNAPCPSWSSETVALAWETFISGRADRCRPTKGALISARGVARTDAEARAAEEVGQIWLAKNPLGPSSRSAGCVQCGGTNPDTPVLANGGHAWLHHECWPLLMRRREADARAAIHSILGRPRIEAPPKQLLDWVIVG